MLVLSRKTGERILVGDHIAITVVRISQGTVRIGIDAPRNLSVVREEVVLQDNACISSDSSMEIPLPQPPAMENPSSL